MPKSRNVFLFLLAAAVFMTGCRSRQEWSQVFASRGRDYVKQGRLESAADEFEKAMRIDRKNAEVYLDAADLFYKMNQPKRVIETLNIAFSLRSDASVRYWALYAECLAAVGQLKMSERYFKKAAEADPSNPEYLKRVQEVSRLIKKEAV